MDLWLLKLKTYLSFLSIQILENQASVDIVTPRVTKSDGHIAVWDFCGLLILDVNQRKLLIKYWQL